MPHTSCCMSDHAHCMSTTTYRIWHTACRIPYIVAVVLVVRIGVGVGVGPGVGVGVGPGVGVGVGVQK